MEIRNLLIFSCCFCQISFQCFQSLFEIILILASFLLCQEHLQNAALRFLSCWITNFSVLNANTYLNRLEQICLLHEPSLTSRKDSSVFQNRDKLQVFQDKVGQPQGSLSPDPARCCPSLETYKFPFFSGVRYTMSCITHSANVTLIT